MIAEMKLRNENNVIKEVADYIRKETKFFETETHTPLSGKNWRPFWRSCVLRNAFEINLNYLGIEGEIKYVGC